MNVRLSFLLVAVLILFGGTFLAVRLTDSNEPRQEQDWLYRVSEDDIVHITVTHNGQTVNYDRVPGSFNWMIQGDPDVPVFPQKWSGTTLLLGGPRVNRTLAEEISNPAQYGLEPPDATVQVTVRSGRVYEFHLGAETPDEQNQYARLVGSPKLFSVPEIWGQVISNLALEPPYLQLYQIPEENEIGRIEVTVGDQRGVYVIQGDGRWYLQTDPQVAVDPEQWEGIPEMLRGPNAEQIVEERLEDPAQYGLESPQARVRVVEFAGRPIDFYIGDTTPDGNYRYVHLAQSGPTPPQLLAMLESRAQTLMRLATDPPVPPPAGTPEPDETPENG